MVRRLLALLFVLALVPAVGEVLETVLHAVQHGDAGHAVADDHGGEPLGADEHGCSPVLHLCGCHAPTPAHVVAVELSAVAVEAAALIGPLAPPGRSGLDRPEPPTRPPIA